ncbi:DNA polymerase IV [Gemmata obscuriglobus]|uniref:DNA polymerase n=1 Tax=Gemmata obscuriglobus TaxID=114 RepID=A0A2Z3GXK7_9BACT|nr:DNA-directed DNA polymerase [Gemmata obscuriglobus]AWM36237.1 DNA polymerase [Gemmata obscuriglobus]QEG31160.1 DNA polymerase IV [Gemmata obscuriglobus]VTS10498.1 dna-directed dna polymerase : DNA-directed DNA polymerase OS=Meiothermus ruber (strain ATCC 35948 / DSM 1279 / VKM B-1258 / 21) GN=K649_07380 PE=4 SV=1: IMS: IMS_C [Gemmata obscuriglobus UQM 2246]
MPLRYLFIDMNSFFASVEQQHDPDLRGKPIAVIPTRAETTACIAASYEAKAFGVKTGTPVWEARKLCPGIILVSTGHKRYVTMHNRILAAVRSVLPIDSVRSIDEMSCKLTGSDREPARARALAEQVKRAIHDLAGECMTCSIGIGPNVLLAKVAADMQKPNGLTPLTDADLPHALHRLQLNDFPGVGPRMERRLRLCGICTVAQFCAASAKALSDVWGSKVIGERWHGLLHGDEVPETPTRRQTVSHSHVLPPNLRTDEKAYGVLMRLVHKAAARLRKIGYWCGSVSVGVRFLGADRSARVRWDESARVPRCQDTPALVAVVAKLWAGRPRGGAPFKVGVVLSDLVPARSATPSLFDEDHQGGNISAALDEVNAEFGASVVYLGAMFGMRDAAPSRVAFTQIPDFDRRVN